MFLSYNCKVLTRSVDDAGNMVILLLHAARTIRRVECELLPSVDAVMWID